MNNPKVLVVAPTHERKLYALERYFTALSNLTYANKEFYFVDNSASPTFHIQNILLNGWNCDWVTPAGLQNNEYIAESQQQLRRYFLLSDCTHFFSTECDLILPKGIIEEMLSYNADCVSCQYMIGSGVGSKLMKFQYDDTWSECTNRRMGTYESFVEYGTGKTKSLNPGLGAIMFTREVMNQISFYVNPEDEVHSDSHLATTLDFLGIKVVYHDEIIPHLNQNWNAISDYKI